MVGKGEGGLYGVVGGMGVIALLAYVIWKEMQSCATCSAENMV